MHIRQNFVDKQPETLIIVILITTILCSEKVRPGFAGISRGSARFDGCRPSHADAVFLAQGASDRAGAGT
ncbi:MAG: hypothetical protein OXU23_10100, partial [Candidatus Poribacteria bacterium]|nr:hypothetical protein [Candidatus Poribacteria bacterium]